MAAVHFIRRLDKASQTPAISGLHRQETHMADEVRTSPALSSQKYKGNPVDVLWINSIATVQLTSYRSYAMAAIGLSETSSILNTLSSLS